MPQKNNPPRNHTGGPDGYTELDGVLTFVGTDATVELDVTPLRYCLVTSLVPIGAPAAAPNLSVDEASLIDAEQGMISVPATGTITVRRTSTAVSGLNLAFCVRGI